MQKTITVNEKYKYYEANSILRNEKDYPKESIAKAKKTIESYLKKNPRNDLPVITDEQRAEIKKKYPNTYKN
ncbi:MAG: hypothetical protein AB8G11_09590 [Saprospiraceae bacterium]